MIRFFQQFYLGIRFFFGSIRILSKKNNWLYFIIPLAIKIFVWLFAVMSIVTCNQHMREFFQELISLNQIPESGHWLSALKQTMQIHSGSIALIISFLMNFLLFYFIATFNKYLMLIVLSPILSLVSESTEQLINGNSFSFRPLKWIKDCARGIIIALRNLIVEYLFFFFGFLFLLIPFSGLILFTIYQVFLIVLSWYFFGFSLLDYSCERHTMGIRSSLEFMRRNKGMACGIGCMYWLIITPPIIGDWIGICFAPVMGAAGSTLAFLSIQQHNSKNHD